MTTKISTESGWLFTLVGLLAAFVGGGAAARVLALPLPPALVGLGAVLLALRIGVMFAAVAEPPPTPAPRHHPAADVPRGPALRPANG